MGEIMLLIDRWERAEHMTFSIGEFGQRLHELLSHSFLSLLLEKFFFVEPPVPLDDYSKKRLIVLNHAGLKKVLSTFLSQFQISELS